MKENKVFTNLIWRFSERICAQGIKLLVEIILARILMPDVYGTIALITVITNILQVFVDAGLGNALIQKKDADNTDFSTVFFANIIFCIIIYCILFIGAPVIADFYSLPELTPYIRVLGLTIVISGVKNIQQAYVSKKLLFKKFFFATLGGTIISGVIGIIMALYGLGAWALIEQQIVNLLLDTIILWITVKWRPKMVFSFTKFRELFSYGWKLLVSSMLDTVYNNVRQLLIGKIYSPASLAQYNRGKQFPNLIVNNVNISIDSVLLPVLSLEQDNKEKVKAMTRRAIKVSTYVMAPLMMGLAFCGESVVGLILTDKWLPSVFFMRVFCVSFMFYPIHTANLNAIKAMGRSDIFLKLEIQKKIIGVIALLVSVFISVKAIALSLIFTSVVGQIINASPNKTLLEYGYIEQLKDILPSIVLAVVMGITIYPIQFFNLSYFTTLIIQILLGFMVYVVGSKIIKIDSFNYLLNIIKSLLKK